MQNIHIRKYVDDNIDTYVEPFSGSFSCGINLMDEGFLHKTVINDKDFRVYNFWKSIQTDADKVYTEILYMYKQIEFTNSITQQQSILSKYQDTHDNYKLAAYEYLYRHSITIKGKSLINIENLESKRDNFIETSIRIMNSIIDNNDCFECIQKYDSKNTFFMIDPPYPIKNIDSYYRCKSSQFNHEALKDLLQNISGKWITRYNYDKNIVNMYKQFNIKTQERPLFGKTYKEIFISNLNLE
jgi:site-specific DNA-adenine methylase